MANLPASTDYTDKDFESVRSRMFSLVRSVFPRWTNESVADFGNMLVESFSWICDVLLYYQDNQAREGRFGTAVLRQSMIALVKLIGYDIPNATAATADVVVTIDNASELVGTVTTTAPGVPVVVKTTEVTDPIRGELISPIPFAISVVDGSKSFTWQHSITQPRFTRASTGLIDQRYLLPFGPFLDGSQVVSTTGEGEFTRVNSFFNSTPTDKHYRLQIDQNDRAEIIFGDGINGIVPSGTINIDYKTGGGIDGNVEPNSLLIVEGNFVDSQGTRAYLFANNAADASGGEPREEVDGTRVNAPASLRVLTRTVAREDYEINARRVSGVGRALMLTSNEDISIDENTGNLYIVPSDGGTPSQNLLDSVEYMCTVTYPHTVTFQLYIKPVDYLTVDIIAWVWLRQDTVPSTVKATILSNLEDYFEPMLASGAPNPDIDFGWNYKDEDGNPAGEIPLSDIYNIVRDTTGVRKIGTADEQFTLNGLHDDLSIPNHKFPQLGDVTIINGKTGTEI
jgi:hypothetical protein